MLHLSVGSTRRGREELGSAEAAGQTPGRRGPFDHVVRAEGVI